MQKYEENLAARINGNNLQPLAEASITVTDNATGLPAALYQADELTLIAQPLETDESGFFGFKAANGEYTLTISGSRFATFTRQITLIDPDQIAGSADNLHFIQLGAGAVARNVADKLRESVSVKDFGGACDGVADDTAAIQAALDSGAKRITLGGLACRTTGSIYLRRTLTCLDLQGGQILFDASANNLAAVVIDNPTDAPTLYQSLMNGYIYGVGSTASRTGIVGVLIKDGVHHPVTRNIGIQMAGATAFLIQGGPVGGNDTPYYGLHENIKAQLCAHGFVVQAPDGAPRITTHTFVNPVSGGHTGRGIYLKNAEFIKLDGPHLEQNGAANLRFENCGTNYVFGGFHEGGNPNIETINQDPLRANVILADVYPSSPNGTGTRVTTYYQNPALGMQSNAILLERASSMQVLFAADDILELKFPGIVTIQTDQSTFARAYLNNGAIELIETGGANGSLWALAKDAATKLNLYVEGGKYYVQNKTGSGVNFRFFTQCGF